MIETKKTVKTAFWRQIQYFKFSREHYEMNVIQILNQFESAFVQFLDPRTPKAQRDAIGGNQLLELISRPGICRFRETG